MIEEEGVWVVPHEHRCVRSWTETGCMVHAGEEETGEAQGTSPQLGPVPSGCPIRFVVRTQGRWQAIKV